MKLFTYFIKKIKTFLLFIYVYFSYNIKKIAINNRKNYYHYNKNNWYYQRINYLIDTFFISKFDLFFIINFNII